jgi:hypothetical protein
VVELGRFVRGLHTLGGKAKPFHGTLAISDEATLPAGRPLKRPPPAFVPVGAKILHFLRNQARVKLPPFACIRRAADAGASGGWKL